MMILIGTDRSTEALDIGYDVNGNRRHVVHYLPIYNAIKARTGLEYDALSDAPYRHAVNAMHRIGGKRYHNRKYGGGIVFTLDKSELEKAVNESIDQYCRWLSSETVSVETLKAAADTGICRLPIVVKSTNYGYIVTGEYSNRLKLRIKVTYDNALSSTENARNAALLWAKKAEFKRWQQNGQDCTIDVLPTYTALDANTRIYLYSIQGY